MHVGPSTFLNLGSVDLSLYKVKKENRSDTIEVEAPHLKEPIELSFTTGFTEQSFADNGTQYVSFQMKHAYHEHKLE